MDLAHVENADKSTTRSELGFQSFGGASGVDGAAMSPSDGCNISNTRQAYEFLMTSEEGMARRALVESLSQVRLMAVHAVWSDQSRITMIMPVYPAMLMHLSTCRCCDVV